MLRRNDEYRASTAIDLSRATRATTPSYGRMGAVRRCFSSPSFIVVFVNGRRGPERQGRKCVRTVLSKRLRVRVPPSVNFLFRKFSPTPQYAMLRISRHLPLCHSACLCLLSRHGGTSKRSKPVNNRSTIVPPTLARNEGEKKTKSRRGERRFSPHSCGKPSQVLKFLLSPDGVKHGFHYGTAALRCNMMKFHCDG